MYSRLDAGGQREIYISDVVLHGTGSRTILECVTETRLAERRSDWCRQKYLAKKELLGCLAAQLFVSHEHGEEL